MMISKHAPEPTPGWISFTTDGSVQYYPYCDDFGPYNLSALYRFCSELQGLLDMHPSQSILYFTTGNARQATNCAFLFAAFLVMHLDLDAQAAWAPFSAIPASSFVPFRDASHAPADFHLSIPDCLHGLARARAAGIVAFRGPAAFCVEDYDHLEDPANGDVHVLVPGRFVAFKGPTEAGIPAGRLWADRDGCRDFHPAHYAGLFVQLGVRAVVRLNERRYDPAHFERAGIAVHALPFPDCTAPPLPVVFRFFRAADAPAADPAARAVAVHCRAGLGRTGTLVALWLMKTHRFAAREAIAWLRLVRPGSVIGPQQQYLVGMEAKMWRWGALPPAKQAHLLHRGCELTADGHYAEGPPALSVPALHAPAPPSLAPAGAAEDSESDRAGGPGAMAGAFAAAAERRAAARGGGGCTGYGAGA
jgi:cell division cycle 14